MIKRKAIASPDSTDSSAGAYCWHQGNTSLTGSSTSLHHLMGAKGMWVLHPDPKSQIADGLPKIWICSSQNKVNLGSLHGLDSTHRIFDLVAPSHVTGPTSRLSSQTLVNLTHNGVSTDLLKELWSSGFKFMMKFEQSADNVQVRLINMRSEVPDSKHDRKIHGAIEVGAKGGNWKKTPAAYILVASAATAAGKVLN
ncbi:hypothetical protein M405DRAFT_843615 [Rhizopogon salebrosus TDB-379]|nr:hypothetical protein M405DRAFT_843615 [Rhizopogon salebrosus TDB-379]